MTPPPSAHVLVTGASSGIGRAIALDHAARGERLTLLARRAKRLEAVADEARATGATVDWVACDVTDPLALKAAIAAAEARAPLTRLYVNAGLGGSLSQSGQDGEAPDAARAILTTNLVAAVDTVGFALPQMLARGRGEVALIASVAGHVGLPDCPSYSAGKAGLRVYGDGIRRLVAGRGVTVTIVSPGFVESPMSASLVGVPRPFLIPAEEAARQIVAAVDRGRREIVLPAPWRIVTTLLRALPRWVLDALFRLRPDRG